MPSDVTSTCSGGFQVQVPASVADVEKADDSITKAASERSVDIEHVHVDDDPRKWSHMRKVSRSVATIDVATGSVTCHWLLSFTWSLDEYTVHGLLRNDGRRPHLEHIQPRVSFSYISTVVTALLNLCLWKPRSSRSRPTCEPRVGASV
jgi:hypothetical protein